MNRNFPVFDLDRLCRDIMAMNEANAAAYRAMTPPTKPDAEAIPGREDLDSDELVDGGAVGAVSQEGDGS